MKLRAALAGSFLVGLTGCSSSPLPTMNLSGMALPRFEMFRYGVDDPAVPTQPYTLSPVETAAIKSQFSAAFTDGRTLLFGPITARRKPETGTLIVCGLVSVRTVEGHDSGMSLFDGSGAPSPAGTLAFTPRRIAGANAEAIDIYGDCRDAGAL